MELTKDGGSDGVSRSWLTQFARGGITNPTIDTLQTVSDACDRVLDVEQAAPIEAAK